jgi:hypothetical protein
LVCKTVCRKIKKARKARTHKGSELHGQKTPTLKAARSSRAERTKETVGNKRFQRFFLVLGQSEKVKNGDKKSK